MPVNPLHESVTSLCLRAVHYVMRTLDNVGLSQPEAWKTLPNLCSDNSRTGPLLYAVCHFSLDPEERI